MTYTTSDQAQAHLKIALETRSWRAVRAALATLDGSIRKPDTNHHAGGTQQMNGYAEMHPLDLKVRADTLETIAGYADEARVSKELAFAVPALDESDPDSFRWLAALIAAKVEYMEFNADSTGGTQ